MIEKAYAKINLLLNVCNKREDGFHDIQSIMLPLWLHDTLEIEILKDSRSEDDFVVCDNYKVGISKYNLCHKAIAVARKKWNFKEHFNIFIHKNIFLQSGLGGGSADAAAVVRSILELLKIKASKQEIIEVAREIGSDVPFAMFNNPSVVTGVGNELDKFDFNSKYLDYYIVLLKPEAGISTTQIYEKFDELNNPNKYDYKKALNALISGDDDLKNYIGNSLEDAAYLIIPELEDLKKQLINSGFEMVFMTGGGSCLVGLTPNKKLAKKTEKLYWDNPKYECIFTTFLKNKDQCIL